tara:strand:- start:190 stop:489 length:300 start_codon:yes stop_codon:yes gene_type:complete
MDFLETINPDLGQTGILPFEILFKAAAPFLTKECPMNESTIPTAFSTALTRNITNLKCRLMKDINQGSAVPVKRRDFTMTPVLIFTGHSIEQSPSVAQV